MRATREDGGWRRRAALKDGTPVLLRQIRPEDRERLAEGLRALSPTSRYLRFHADIEELTPAELEHLTRVDHHDHEAIVAVDLDRPEVPGVGVARYVRDAYERDVAEVVVTVADRYHGQGAATLLFGALAARARSTGVEVFRHNVLADNPGMLSFLEHLGATRERVGEGRWRVDLHLPVRAGDLPANPAARAFRRAMRQSAGVRPLPGAGHLRRRPPRTSRPSLAAHIDAGLAGQEGREAAVVSWLAERDRRGPRWPSMP